MPELIEVQYQNYSFARDAKQSGNGVKGSPKWGRREGQAANQLKVCKKEIDKTTAKAPRNSFNTNILVNKATASCTVPDSNPVLLLLSKLVDSCNN